MIVHGDEGVFSISFLSDGILRYIYRIPGFRKFSYTFHYS
jgi:hypothetical protein